MHIILENRLREKHFKNKKAKLVFHKIKLYKSPYVGILVQFIYMYIDLSINYMKDIKYNIILIIQLHIEAYTSRLKTI